MTTSRQPRCAECSPGAVVYSPWPDAAITVLNRFEVYDISSHDTTPATSASTSDSNFDFDGPPRTPQLLEERIGAIARRLGIPSRRARVLVASTICAQMLPGETVLKGGMGIKMRLGEVGTRATRDLDVVARDRAAFQSELARRLAAGWGTVPPSKGALKKDSNAPARVAFTGVVRPSKPAKAPDDVPAAYLMEPYNVTLSFMGSAWAAVPLEVGHDEIDGLADAEFDAEVADQVAAIASVLGFGTLAPVPLISLAQQIAQKIHAVTYPGSQRAYDLVDVQLLWHAGTDDGSLDLAALARMCERTFAYRRQHDWPPSVALSGDLDGLYSAALEEVLTAQTINRYDESDGVDASDTHSLDAAVAAGWPNPVPTLAEASDWLTHRISEIAAAASQPSTWDHDDA